MSDSSRASPQERKLITVYVRRGSDQHRRLITFQRPPEVPVTELLDNNLAIDYNSVRGEIFPTESTGIPDSDDMVLAGFGALGKDGCVHDTLTHALVESQGWLIKFLGKYGYEVDFQ